MSFWRAENRVSWCFGRVVAHGGKRGPDVARRSDQPRAAKTHTGSNHQALTPATWTSSAVSARAATTTAATRQSSPTTKSYQKAPIDLSRFKS
jgi:hypothetical protein